MGFMAGFARGIQDLPAVMERARERQAMQDLQKKKAMGDALKESLEIIENAPEENVAGYLGMMFQQIEQISGKPIDPSVKKMVSSDPQGSVRKLMDFYAGRGGFDQDTLGSIMSNPAMFMRISAAFDKRSKAAEQRKQAELAMGVEHPEPVDYSLTAPTQAPGIQRAPVGVGTPQAEIAGLAQRAHSLRQGIAYFMGIGDKDNAANLQRQLGDLVQQERLARERTGELAEAGSRGKAMGELVNPDVAARTGIPPLATVREAREGMGGIRLPNPEDIKGYETIREDEKQRMKTSREAVDAARAQDAQLDTLKALSKSFTTGKYAGVQLQAEKLMKALFGVESKLVAPGAAMEMFVGQLALTNQIAMKGNTSNSDRDWLISISPNITTDPNALSIFIDIQKTLNERVQTKSVFEKKYYSACGVAGEKCSVSLDEAWQAHVDRNPLQGKFESIVSKYNTPAEKSRQRGATGSWDPLATPRQPRLFQTPPVPSAESEEGAAFGVPPRGIRPRY